MSALETIWQRRLGVEARLRDDFLSDALPRDLNAIIILAGWLGEGDEENWLPNAERVVRGIRLLRDFACKYLAVDIDDDPAALRGYEGHLPTLVMNGEREITRQLAVMKTIAVALGVPEGLIELQCNELPQPDGSVVAHTGTQMQVIGRDYGGQSVALVTHHTHGPRVLRTAMAQLPKDVSVVVRTCLGDEQLIPIQGEVKRILAYAKKGDVQLVAGQRMY